MIPQGDSIPQGQGDSIQKGLIPRGGAPITQKKMYHFFPDFFFLESSEMYAKFFKLKWEQKYFFSPILMIFFLHAFQMIKKKKSNFSCQSFFGIFIFIFLESSETYTDLSEIEQNSFFLRNFLSQNLSQKLEMKKKIAEKIGKMLLHTFQNIANPLGPKSFGHL